ncbi:MAG: MmcQ/YjbR family DNA-binding protein [Alphaproteobacteria bacterium]|nr:MmcQ/YjbR family DNA-binding protein [Alphaproteobacteria bacterium]MCB9696230.1 MmcQ/YjbR family DNA-binding protein [Alphaproteobacteria bacterium]
MDIHEFRRNALAQADATERDHHGFPSFRVANRIFATLPEPGIAHLMMDEDAIHEAVMLDQACEEKWWGTKLAAVRVDLERVADDVLVQLLQEAWTHASRKR